MGPWLATGDHGETETTRDDRRKSWFSPGTDVRAESGGDDESARRPVAYDEEGLPAWAEAANRRAREPVSGHIHDRIPGLEPGVFVAPSSTSVFVQPRVGAIGLRVTEDRVLICADEDSHAPTETASGLLLAPTMASAVEGTDAAESWCTGRIVQVGPLVGRRDVRKQLAGWLLALEGEGHGVTVKEIANVRHRVEQLRADAEPLRVGQRVAFSWQTGYQIAVDGVPYVVLRAGDVLAVVED